MKPVQFLMLYHTDMVGSSASFSTKPHRAGAITVTLPVLEPQPETLLPRTEHRSTVSQEIIILWLGSGGSTHPVVVEAG